ncbi:hypothetical protein [Solimonas soli]|nr:hypothetical protein [Solimonas soli]
MTKKGKGRLRAAFFVHADVVGFAASAARRAAALDLGAPRIR